MFGVLIQKMYKSPFLNFFSVRKTFKKDKRMLYIKLEKVLKFVILCFVFSLVLFATDAFAAEKKSLFSDLTATGSNIFMGMREIVYAVSGFGIVAVAVGGFFGNLNWKWLSAIIIGLVIIALTASIINYMTDNNIAGSRNSVIGITDTLKSGDDTMR